VVNTAALAYVSLFAVSGVACLAAVPRARTFETPAVRRGLVGLLVTSGLWALFKTAFFTLPEQFQEGLYTVGLIFGFATVWSWLYFCSAYTGRDYHENATARRLSAVVFLAVVSAKVTNPIHERYFTTTEVAVPFEHLAIDHGIFHWAATGLSYVLAALGMFMIYELYVESGYDTGPLAALTGLLALPILLDLVALLTPWLVSVIYAPLGVAAFAIGALFVFERRFLAIQSSAEIDDPSIYLDEQGRIQDYSPGAEAVLPELGGATGERLGDALPGVASVLDGGERIIERSEGDERRYYFVSTTAVAVGDSGVRVLTLSDVTETERQRRQLQRRERDLKEQNELYDAIIAASFSFVFRIDPEGRFTYVSSSVEEFLGYTADDLRGEPISVPHPDEETTERAWNQLEQVLNGEPNEVLDFPLETKNGRTVYTDVRAVPVYDVEVPPEERSSSDIRGVQLMVRDATERRQREGLISVTNRVLRHNVRNEMNVVTGYAKMLKEELDGDRAAKAKLIEDTADRLLEISDSARLIAENRELSPELEPIDLVPIVDRSLTRLETRYPDVSVTTSVPDEAVAATLPRIETGLWELLDNAARYGGDPPSIDLDVTVTGTDVVVTVSDEGSGLPETEREVLRTGKETPLAHGQGLGLWLAYWLVTNLDGRLAVTEYEDGTTIEIRLPRPS